MDATKSITNYDVKYKGSYKHLTTGWRYPIKSDLEDMWEIADDDGDITIQPKGDFEKPKLKEELLNEQLKKDIELFDLYSAAALTGCIAKHNSNYGHFTSSIGSLCADATLVAKGMVEARNNYINSLTKID